MKRCTGIASLYGFLLVFAITGAVAATEAEDIRALRDMSMQKLVVHDEPRPTPDTPVFDGNDRQVRIEDFKGKVLVMNFWATWCAPCRKEMPSLDRLAARMEDQGVKVIAIAAGPNPRPGVDRFLAETGIQHLDIYYDPKMELMRSFRVFGIPITFILDRDGNELARLTGDAEWDSESAIDIIEHIASGRVPGVE